MATFGSHAGRSKDTRGALLGSSLSNPRFGSRFPNQIIHKPPKGERGHPGVTPGLVFNAAVAHAVVVLGLLSGSCAVHLGGHCGGSLPGPLGGPPGGRSRWPLLGHTRVSPKLRVEMTGMDPLDAKNVELSANQQKPRITNKLCGQFSKLSLIRF